MNMELTCNATLIKSALSKSAGFSGDQMFSFSKLMLSNFPLKFKVRTGLNGCSLISLEGSVNRSLIQNMINFLKMTTVCAILVTHTDIVASGFCHAHALVQNCVCWAPTAISDRVKSTDFPRGLSRENEEETRAR